MGLLKLILFVVGFLVLTVVGLGAYLWFTDYEVDARVTDKGRDQFGDYVIVKPRILPFEYKHGLGSQEAAFVCEGYEVQFRVQTHRIRVFDDRGVLVYDSDTGLEDTGALVRCGATNAGGGIVRTVPA